MTKISAIEQVIGEMRAVSAVAQGRPVERPQVLNENAVDFADVFKSSLNNVNSLQQAAQSLQRQFELGNDNINLHDVMISMQKASLSFQTMVQVRNKMVSAYQEIMNTPV